MTTRKLSDAVAELAMERIASLLADRVADRVVKALMDAGFDQQFANELLLALKRQVEDEERR